MPEFYNLTTNIYGVCTSNADLTNTNMTEMKKGNKQCLLDTPRTVRVSEKTWQVIVQTSRP